MAFDKKLMEIIVCPICKGKLEYQKEEKRLICKFDRVAYPIDEGIPVLLEDKAIPLSESV